MTRRTFLLAFALALALGLGDKAEANVGRKAKGLARQSASQVYYRNRCFDPATGRFLQRDPVLGGDPLYNPYCFPGNNPVTNADPMGTEWIVLNNLVDAEGKPIAPIRVWHHEGAGTEAALKADRESKFPDAECQIVPLGVATGVAPDSDEQKAKRGFVQATTREMGWCVVPVEDFQKIVTSTTYWVNRVKSTNSSIHAGEENAKNAILEAERAKATARRLAREKNAQAEYDRLKAILVEEKVASVVIDFPKFKDLYVEGKKYSEYESLIVQAAIDARKAFLPMKVMETAGSKDVGNVIPAGVKQLVVDVQFVERPVPFEIGGSPDMGGRRIRGLRFGGNFGLEVSMPLYEALVAAHPSVTVTQFDAAKNKISSSWSYILQEGSAMGGAGTSINAPTTRSFPLKDTTTGVTIEFGIPGAEDIEVRQLSR